MKKLAFLGVSTFLAACGGGGGAGGSSSSNPYNVETGGISKTTSTNYSNGLKVFAESFRGLELLTSLADIALLSGHSGSCPKSGTLAFAGNTQTLNQCVRNFPSDKIYTGSYTANLTNTSPTSYSFSVPAFTNFKASDAANSATTLFTIPNGSGQYISGTQTDNDTSDTTIFTDGIVSFQVGANTYYSITRPQLTVLNNQLSLTINSSYTNSGFKLRTTGASILSGSYGISIQQPVVMTGTNFPSSGSLKIYNDTQDAGLIADGICTVWQLDFLSPSTFKITCNGDSITKGWNDVDVKAARASAIQ